ncbi:hypothetical protein ABQD91_08975 [Enterococcus hirae]
MAKKTLYLCYIQIINQIREGDLMTEIAEGRGFTKAEIDKQKKNRRERL